MIIENFKFYTPVEGKPDQIQCWRIRSALDLAARLEYWSKKFYIKTAYYEWKDTETGERESQQIDMVHWTDEHEVLFIKKET